MTSEFVVALCTTPDIDTARQITGQLLGKKLAACVNILDGVESHFWWQGKIENESECLLVVKTTAALLPALTETIKELHSYSLPEVITLPIIGGNAEYLAWLKESTA
ncbi:divalent-cation tolerance protein CutA [Chloroflexota bacterium]